MKIEGPRGVKPEEYDEMLELVKLVFRADLGERVPLLYNPENIENLRILKVNGRIVTHIGVSIKEVSILGCRTKVGSIGSVCTHPDYRRRGFATMVLEDIIRKLEREGVTVMSVSGGRGLYQRLGCRYVGKRLIFNINRSDIGKFPPLYPVELVPYEKERHLREIAFIHQGEPIRFWRPLEDFEAILSVVSVSVICRDGRPVGYMQVNIRRDDTGEVRCNVGEFAGSRLALISAVKLLFENYGLTELSLGTLPQDTELTLILEEIGLKPNISNLGNTMRIINLPLLMDHFKPYIRQRVSTKVAEQLKVGREKGKYLFQLGDERFLVEDEASLVKMVLGTPDEEERRIMPRKGKLARVLREIFPFPFVWPGLNNV